MPRPTSGSNSGAFRWTHPRGDDGKLRYREGTPSGLTVRAFPVLGDPPRFATEDVPGHTVGLFIGDRVSGGSCAFVPGCGELDQALLDQLSGAQLLLFDG